MVMIVALLAAGIALLIAELMLPGAVMGMLGLGCVAVGLVLAFAHDLMTGMVATAAVAVVGLVGLWLWVKFFPDSKLGHRMFLRKTAKHWKGWEEANETFLGGTGIADSLLRPVGVATINGKRIDVITRGETIDKGQPIKVIQVEGNRIVVTLDASPASGVPAPPVP